jgi:L-ascorbate metabolism protein UlaG (beta-lactamase superfamily)
LPRTVRTGYRRPIAGVEPSLTYLGHSTVVLDLAGGCVLTDPVLRGRVGYLRRVAAPVPAAALARVDAILVSHVHHDHLDGPSLRRVGTHIPVIAPRGARTLLRNKGVRTVVELLPGESTQVAGVTVRATEAEHSVTRLPGGRPVPALGYVVDGGPRVYFAGDTDLFAGMEQIGDAALDVALLPVVGWGPRLPPGHLDAVRAAAALRLLRPRTAVPIHWGTLAPMWWRPQDDDARRAAAEHFRREAATVAPDVDVRVLAPGQALSLGADRER